MRRVDKYAASLFDGLVGKGMIQNYVFNLTTIPPLILHLPHSLFLLEERAERRITWWLHYYMWAGTSVSGSEVQLRRPCPCVCHEMSNSSDSLSPIDSSHTSLGDEGDGDGWGGLEDGQLLQQLKVLEASDHVRELQTIIRDRLVEKVCVCVREKI